MHALVLNCINQYMKFEVISFTNYRDMSGAKFRKKTGHVTPSMPLLVVLCRHRLGFDVVYLRAQFDESSFSLSRDIIGVSKLKVGQVTLTTPLSGIVCLPWASTCYDRPIYQI